MNLSADGKKLLLAEVTAHSVITTLDINGDLSSNFNLRHKIRDADITDILERTYKTPAGSYARALMSMQLQVFSSAAYSASDQKNLLTSNEASLKIAKVTPHFGSTPIKLHNACVSEPMNLWFGLAKENQQKNMHVFDPHMISVEVYGNVAWHVSLPSNGTVNNTSTQNATILSAMANKSHVVLQGNYTSPTPPTVTRRNTPTSEALSQMVQAVNQKHELIAPQELINLYSQIRNQTDLIQFDNRVLDYRKKIVEALNKMRDHLVLTTKAGEDHYQDLLHQLNLRNYQGTDCYNRLSSAKDSWSGNRASMLQLLDSIKTTCEGSATKLIFNQWGLYIPHNYILVQNLS